MDASAVVTVLDRLECAGVEVWIDGGWAVDALLGYQTRPHDDLDVVIPHTQIDCFNRVMDRFGFQPDVAHTSFNWELVDSNLDRIDVHLVDVTTIRLDRFGIEVHGPGGLEYEVGCFDGRGVIAGKPVRCLNAEILVRYHTGYELTEKDYHDVMALHRRFGVPLPYPYDPEGDRTNWMTRLDGTN
jgi:lincosamide nucleotidyltransferase A/C/D/E